MEHIYQVNTVQLACESAKESISICGWLFSDTCLLVLEFTQKKYSPFDFNAIAVCKAYLASVDL